MESASDNIFSCFRDRVAVITGAGGTIGGESAAMFAKYGASLVLIDNHAGRLDDIVVRLKQYGHPEDKILARLGDVTSQDDIDKLVDDAVSRFQRIDHLVNVVGVKKTAPLKSATLETLDESFLDVRVTYNVTKACLPHLINTKGSVINLSSAAGLKAYPQAVCYGSSKASLQHMSKVMAIDLGKKGVRVNCVVPTSIMSDSQLISGAVKTREEQDAYFKMVASVTPLGRVVLPVEVAQTILFLSSDAASFITGAILPIDGGYTLSDRRVL